MPTHLLVIRSLSSLRGVRGNASWLTQGCGPHGACDLATRVCVCADGWALPLCLTWNVGNSRSGEFAALSSNPDADADTVVVTDEEHSLVYTGGLPLQVITVEIPRARRICTTRPYMLPNP